MNRETLDAVPSYLGLMRLRLLGRSDEARSGLRIIVNAKALMAFSVANNVVPRHLWSSLWLITWCQDTYYLLCGYRQAGAPLIRENPLI